MFVATPLQAAPSGLPDGRSAQVSDLSRYSGEIGYRHSENGPLTGLRLNLRVGADSLLFIDAAKTSDSIDGVAAAAEVDVSGTAYGIGIYHNLPRINDAIHLGIRAGFHQIASDVDENLVVGNVRADAEVDRLMFDMAILLSPAKPLLDTGLQGYVALGLARREDQQQVNVDGIRNPRLDKRRVDTDATIAAGVVLPIRMGQLYAVVEHDRVASVSLGFRLLTE
jgi:hypothetical protein